MRRRLAPPKIAPLLNEEGMLGHPAQWGWLEVAREPGFNGFQPPRQQPLAAVCPSLSKEGSRYRTWRPHTAGETPPKIEEVKQAPFSALWPSAGA